MILLILTETNQVQTFTKWWWKDYSSDHNEFILNSIIKNHRHPKCKEKWTGTNDHGIASKLQEIEREKSKLYNNTWKIKLQRTENWLFAHHLFGFGLDTQLAVDAACGGVKKQRLLSLRMWRDGNRKRLLLPWFLWLLL